MRGYYRVPKKAPANRVEGALADLVREKFAEGWPKARIAREFRMNRRTVARICNLAPAEVCKTAPSPCTNSPEMPDDLIFVPVLPKWRRFRSRMFPARTELS